MTVYGGYVGITNALHGELPIANQGPAAYDTAGLHALGEFLLDFPHDAQTRPSRSCVSR